MAYAVEFEVLGDVIISRKLLRFGERIQDVRPAWYRIMDQLEEHIAELFESEGSSGGEPWKPLADSTLKHKARRNEQTDILQATRGLLDSLTADTHGAGIREAKPDEFVFGSDLMTENGEYNLLALHQLGGGDGDQPPVRKPLQVTESQKRGYVKELQRYIMEDFS